MMTTIIETAVELFKNEYKVKKWDLIKAKEVLSSLGFKIIYFSSSNDADTQCLLNNLNLESFCVTERCFTYMDANIRLIFLKSFMTDRQTLLVLSHEIGHIFLNHIINCSTSCDKLQNIEADSFAELLLKEKPKKSFLISIAKIIISISILCGMFLVNASKNEIPVKVKSNSDVTTVVVTRTGAKYHLPDCRYVENKTDTEEMTVEEALSEGYGPCKVCEPGTN
jgi:hypothetical protein|nr:MAG TPA: IrrE protein [Caudoviricetes sp.]